MPQTNNIEAFTADLKKFAKTIDADLAKVVKKVALDIFAGVVKRTAVDTGAARASWVISIGLANLGGQASVTGGKLSPQGATAVAMTQVKKLVMIPPYTTIWISNNMPYIEKLEYGGYPDGPKVAGGYPTQAPQGMVRVTMAGVSQVINQAIASV